jgi:hypothetical protein
MSQGRQKVLHAGLPKKLRTAVNAASQGEQPTKPPTTHRNYLPFGTGAGLPTEELTSKSRSRRAPSAGWKTGANFLEMTQRFGGPSGHRCDPAVWKKADVEVESYVEHPPVSY